MTDLSTLADRVEEGTVEMQGSLLGTAFGVLFPRVLASHPDYARRLKDRIAFSTKLDAGAYVDAAMMLVPEGWGWTIGDKSPTPSIAWCEIEGLPWKAGYGWAVERRLMVEAATPALALTSAALRARAHASEATNV